MRQPATDRIRIGTRRSLLAVRQGQIVADALRRSQPGLAVEMVPLATRGDRLRGPLAPEGGKGLFTSELESALRDGRIDLAVHSAKDLPARMDDGFAIAAVPLRDDPRDALVSRGGEPIGELPAGATVGTSSLRRRAQLLAARADLRVVAIRGNVETRLAKVLGGRARRQADATVLAMAGLKRSGLANRHAGDTCVLSAEQFCPAAGQGTLVAQCLADADGVGALCRAIDHAESREALLAERAVVRGLGADCHSCLAAFLSRVSRVSGAAPGARGWLARGMAARADGSDGVRLEAPGDAAADAAAALLEKMMQAGAVSLLKARG